MKAMRTLAATAAVLLLAGGAVPDVAADIVVQEFTDSAGEKSTIGYVFQGSRNMRHLGKSGRASGMLVVSPVVVPALEPVTVLPALENAALSDKPRFGYGSDYVPEGQRYEAAPETPIPVEGQQVIFLKPAYSFNRVYYPRYHNPIYGWGYPFCHSHHHGWPYHSAGGVSVYGDTGSFRFFFRH